VICPSQKVSGTYRSASDAALEYPDMDIRIIDTQTIGSALGTLVLKALEWANEGKPADLIVKSIEEMSKKHVSISTWIHSSTYIRVAGSELLQRW